MPMLDLATQDLACSRCRERAGYGRCTRCKEVLCDQCVTFLEGSVTCPTCIAELADAEEAALIGVGESTGACILGIGLGTTGTMVVLYAITLLFR